MNMGKEQRPAMTTTLYDLISTLHKQVGVEDDQMITAMVTYLLRTGQIRCIATSPTDHDRTGHHQDWHLHDACVVSAVRSSSPRTPPGGIEKPGELGEVACIPEAEEDGLMCHHR
jgi:hypothetical protein